MLTPHHFYHFIIAYLFFLSFFITELEPTLEKVITLNLFGIVLFCFSSIRIWIDVLTKLNNSRLLMTRLSFYLIFDLGFVLRLKMLFFTYFGIYNDWLDKMSFLSMVISLIILRFFKQILNPRPWVILFIVIECFDGRRSTFVPLNQTINTYSG